MRFIALLVVAIALCGVRPAGACPAGSPCLKYRRPPPPPHNPVPVITRYARTIHTTLGRFDRASVVQFLTGSTWDLVGGNERVRFVDPTRIGPHFARPPTRDHDRIVLIRELRSDRGGVMVEIDNEMYTMTACQLAPRVWTECLELRGRIGGGFGGDTYGGR
jgi:hypothetical protein